MDVRGIRQRNWDEDMKGACHAPLQFVYKTGKGRMACVPKQFMFHLGDDSVWFPAPVAPNELGRLRAPVVRRSTDGDPLSCSEHRSPVGAHGMRPYDATGAYQRAPHCASHMASENQQFFDDCYSAVF